MKQLNVTQIEYLENNISIFNINSSASQDQRQLVYDMYNDITGQKKKPNSCGRCWRNVKMAVYKQYLKQTTTL